MASSNLNDVCCICLNQLVKGSECKEACRNLNDNNVEIIERFANAWKEQGSSCYNKCINVCQKYREQKEAASFHVTCYRMLLSNATYLDECKKKSQATVKGNEKDETSASLPETLPSILDSNSNSTTTDNSLQSSEIVNCDTNTLPQAAMILRERLIKLPNGIYNDYTDDPLVYMFFLSLCGGDEDDIPSKNEELNKKILFLCQEFATAVHKHQHQEDSEAAEEDMAYLAQLVMKTVLTTSD